MTILPASAFHALMYAAENKYKPPPEIKEIDEEIKALMNECSQITCIEGMNKHIIRIVNLKLLKDRIYGEWAMKMAAERN